MEVMKEIVQKPPNLFGGPDNRKSYNNAQTESQNTTNQV